MEDEPGFSLDTFTFDFSMSLHDWSAGFSDYVVAADDSAVHQFHFEHTNVPGTPSKAVMLSGKGEGLFMYLKKKVQNLEPHTEYVLTFDIEFASDAKASTTGGVDSPGDKVFLKVGASGIEPKSLIENDYYVMNIDKGDQSQGGEDMIVIGNVSVPADSEGFVVINRTNGPYSGNSSPILVKTSSQGELWLIVGTESGHAGVTTLYYTNFTAVLSKSN